MYMYVYTSICRSSANSEQLALACKHQLQLQRLAININSYFILQFTYSSSSSTSLFLPPELDVEEVVDDDDDEEEELAGFLLKISPVPSSSSPAGAELAPEDLLAPGTGSSSSRDFI